MLPSPPDVTHYVWEAQPASARRRHTDLRRRVTFLRELAKSGSIIYASGRAGVDRRTVYRWRDRDERFRARWDKALERQHEILLDRGYTLACIGSTRFFTRNGRPTASYRRLDEKLIMFMIKEMRARPSTAPPGGAQSTVGPGE
jgi:hypothetical protein